MMRLIFFAVLICAGCRMIFGKWPWDLFRPTPTREQAVFKARRLLGIEAGASHREIRDAHRRMTALVHPDRGGSNAAMQELNAARDLLLDELPREIPERSE